ncbi:hypothetical protein DPV78_007095 [Talaromyces pinophilus]|nr:hypothetical protein DPV78_007095 [Talaromyces pinophilus]
MSSRLSKTMLASFVKFLPQFGRTWKPLNFTNQNFVRIAANQKIEEEQFPEYAASRYYPVRIGEVFRDRYQVAGKLGFGASSTVWLARDMSHRRHVALKIYINSAAMGQQLDDELKMYKRMEKASNKHLGRNAVRTLLDSFNINGPEGEHRCLVHPPLWESVLTFLHRNPIRRLPSPITHLPPLDVKADNIMFGIADDSVFSDFEEDELQRPVPRKEADGRTIYTSRELRMPKEWGAPVLCDFGSAVPGDIEHLEDAQPNIYRAPEVILEVPWTNRIDIWNVGCMIWNVFEGGSLFTRQDPEFQTYRSRAHLAEIISLLGPPPSSFLARGQLTQRFFSDDGDFNAGIEMKQQVPLEERESTLKGEDKAIFIRFMRKMLQWEPSQRSSARELAEDE